MPASSKPRKDERTGDWIFRVVTADGRRVKRRYPAKAEADAALGVFLQERFQARRGELTQPRYVSGKTFRDLTTYWTETRLEAGDRRSGKDDISILRKHLVPFFGARLLTSLTVGDVDRFKCQKVDEGLSPKTVTNILAALRSMLNQAKRLRWIVEVPEIRAKAPNILNAPYRYLETQDEIARFLDAARVEGPAIFALYATAIYTGLRLGELAMLRWSCIDHDRRMILVKESFNGPPKSGKARRVPLPDILAPVLAEWRLRHPAEFVWTTDIGTHLGPGDRRFKAIFHRVLERAGLVASAPLGRRKRFIVFHDLRHTYASHFMLNGGDLFSLKEYLGHSTIVMTQRYAHLSDEALKRDRARFGGVPLSFSRKEGDVLPLRSSLAQPSI